MKNTKSTFRITTRILRVFISFFLACWNLGLFDIPSECFMKSVVIVAKKHIQDEELFLNYRYSSNSGYFNLTFRFNPKNPYPDWFHQPNEEEAKRRWSRRSLLFWLWCDENQDHIKRRLDEERHLGFFSCSLWSTHSSIVRQIRWKYSFSNKQLWIGGNLQQFP